MADSREVAVVGGESPGEVDNLIRFAVERGADVGTLERLVDLQERVEAREARAAFLRALAAFQDTCPEIPKNRSAEIASRQGTGFGYGYADLPSIIRTIKKPLREHGLSYAWDASLDAANGVLNVVCILRHESGHEERSSFPVPVDTKAPMSGAQKHGAALTYGRRQSLVAALGLLTADDIDGAALVGVERPASAETVADLDAKIKELGVDEKKLLEYVGITSMDNLNEGQAERMNDALENWVKQRERRQRNDGEHRT